MDVCKWLRALVSFIYLYNSRKAQTSYSIQAKSNQSINYTMFPGIVDNSQCGKSINFDSKFSSPSIWIRSDGVVGKPHIMLKIWIFQPKVNMNAFILRCTVNVWHVLSVSLPHTESAHGTFKSASAFHRKQYTHLYSKESIPKGVINT